MAMNDKLLHSSSLDEQRLLLPVPEAAKLLGIGTSLCWSLVRSRQLTSVRISKRVLVPRAALLNLIDHLADTAAQEV